MSYFCSKVNLTREWWELSASNGIRFYLFAGKSYGRIKGILVEETMNESIRKCNHDINLNIFFFNNNVNMLQNTGKIAILLQIMQNIIKLNFPLTRDSETLTKLRRSQALPCSCSWSLGVLWRGSPQSGKEAASTALPGLTTSASGGWVSAWEDWRDSCSVCCVA